MKKYVFIALISLVSLAVNWLALLINCWWLTPVSGLVIGGVLRPAWVSFCVSVCVGGFSWGLPLGILALQAPVTSTASAIEAVIGFPPTGGVLLIGLTLLAGCMLSAVGTWLSVALAPLPVRMDLRP
jgi:hypothetical protein